MREFGDELPNGAGVLIVGPAGSQRGHLHESRIFNVSLIEKEFKLVGVEVVNVEN